jgi:hypothetical protein
MRTMAEGSRCCLPWLLLMVAAALPVAASGDLATAEQAFADWREASDQVDLATSRGAVVTGEGSSLPEARARAAALAARARELLTEASAAEEGTGHDAEALATMRAALEAVAPDVAPEASASPTGEPSVADCEPARVAALASAGLATLQQRLYGCFGLVAANLRVGDETLDRLSVLGRLATTAAPAARRQVFMALEPLWRTVNGHGGAVGSDHPSPYRELLRLSAARWAAGDSPVVANLTALGIAPEQAEPWLLAILAAWRDLAPAGEAIEPWDLYFRAGALARALPGPPDVAGLRAVNDAYYAALGADPPVLGVRFDLEPRPGKDPVAFTTFGRRPRLRDGVRLPGEAWVFATYRSGGVDNLIELLHETGHAVHLQALAARPAFADWPDSDTLTEALADVPAMEAYEPAWQRRWLGQAAPLGDSLRAKYGSIVLDIAWALFELRLHRDPAADPNQVWTAITHEYLHVVPHPGLAWWALRGQLIDAPGYMMNYAVGAILVADLRAAVAAGAGRGFEPPLATTYPWLSERLYRWGRGKSSRQVLLDVLGRPPSPAALLADLGRLAIP